MLSVMKKFAFIAAAAVVTILHAATPQSKIPATAVAVASIDLDQVINWPLVAQAGTEMLQGTLAQYQLTLQDIQGTVAAGITFAEDAPAQNGRIDAVISLKQPNAEKLFKVMGNFLSLAHPTGLKTEKSGKKISIVGKDFKLTLVNPKELTFQMLIGNKMKFTELKNNKNLFSNIKEKNAAIIVALDNQKLLAAFAEIIKNSRYSSSDILKFAEGKKLSEIICNLKPDGSLEYKSKDTFASAADAQKAIALCKEKLAEQKADPMLAGVAEKVQFKADGATVVTSCELNILDLTTVLTAVMQKAQQPSQGRSLF